MFRIDDSTDLWQTRDYCPSYGGLVEAGGTSLQRWDFGAFSNETTATLTCPDSVTIRAAHQPGDEGTQRCTDTAAGTEDTTVSEGPYRFIRRPRDDDRCGRLHRGRVLRARVARSGAMIVG